MSWWKIVSIQLNKHSKKQSLVAEDSLDIKINKKTDFLFKAFWSTYTFYNLRSVDHINDKLLETIFS